MKMTILQSFKYLTLMLVAVGAQHCEPTTKTPNISSDCCGMQVYSPSAISGGSRAEVDEYPWLALLEYNVTGNRTPCAGALISSKYVLTSAHCLDHSVWGKPYQVRLSEYNTSSYPTDVIQYSGGSSETVNVVIIATERLVPHPGYKKGDGIISTDDIGLVKLAEDAPYNDFIRPICLPDRDITTTASSDSRIYLISAGWGKAGKSAEIKQQFHLPNVPLEKCQVPYSRLKTPVTLKETQICAGGEENQCGGQPGGPLMMEFSYGDKDVFVLVGVDNYGSETCSSDMPGVYTHVYKYLNWIEKETV